MRDNHEQRRLTAAWLNILAAGVVSAGAVGPTVSVALGTRDPDRLCWAAALGGFWLLLGCTVHLVARATIASLRDPGCQSGGETHDRHENKTGT
jgi:hypothetical protein